MLRTKQQHYLSVLNKDRWVSFLTVAAVRLGVLSSRGPRLGDPVSIVQLLGTVDRCLRLGGERHDGGGGIGGGGVVLAVGEAVQVLTGGIDGAVDWTLGGATYAVLLRLIQVVRDTGFYTGIEVTFIIVFFCCYEY